MSYFSEDFFKFFRGLEKNNNRDWFNRYKPDYEVYVKEPFEVFVGDIIHEVRKYDKDIKLEHKDAIFRIYRDIRFAKDKTPYKVHVSAVISRNGKKDHGYPALFFHLGLKGSMIGGGLHHTEKGDLYKIRKEIQNNYKNFENILAEPKFKKLYGEIKGEKNKILPPEFKKDMDKMPLLLNKDFYYIKEYKDASFLTKSNLLDFMMEHYLAGKKVNNFLKKATAS